MLFELRLTKINPNMTAGMVECCYVSDNSPIKLGDKLFDLRVDLSAGFSQIARRSPTFAWSPGKKEF